MADQRKIVLRQGHGTPRTIVLRELPIASIVVTTIYLYALHATPSTIILRDPTVRDDPGGGGSPTNYTLNCDAGIFAFTGATRLFSVGRRITADAGAFGLTGATRLFRTGRVLIAASGAFAFTGAARTFSHGRSMTMEPGSFAFTGEDETFSFFDAPRPLYRGKWVVS